MAQDWNIKSRGEACTACSVAFADGQAYYSRLVFSEVGYERSDCCETCWEQLSSVAPGHSFWRGLFRLPPPPPAEPLPRETVEALLRRLSAEENEDDIPVIYILAVMLERKRLLVERDVHTEDDGGRVFVYEHRKTGDTFAVRDPELNLGDLDAVQRRVIEMLGGEVQGVSDTAAAGAQVVVPDAAADDAAGGTGETGIARQD